MSEPQFPFPMKKSERIFGWIYLPIHIFLTAVLIAIAYYWILQPMGIELTNIEINAIYYSIGFVLITVFMFKFLKASFHDLCDNKINTLKGILLGYLINLAMLYIVSIVLAVVLKGEIANPNNDAAIELAEIDPNIMTAISVFLAPFVEEVLFRGIAFGTIRNRSRILAYVVSALLFSVYHLFSYFLTELDWTVFIYALQYLPGSIALAWCYEKSRNIWGCIFLHMLINFVSISLSI
jgi:membrane protease YdiL (CAAX protease family)